MTTKPAEQMKEVVADAAPTLKQLGFRKRAHSFNRSTDGGLTHVVSFQMGSFMPPGTQEFPPIRLNLYGKFTINLGVFVPTLARRLERDDSPKWVNEYDCHLRQRIGLLMPVGQDHWWELGNPSTADNAGEALRRFGLPWLHQFETPDDITGGYETFGRVPLGLPPVGPVHIAFLLLDRGDSERAEALISEYLADGSLTAPHRQHLAEFLPKQGLGHLV